MKSKIILSLIMAAAVSMSAATLVTNANFTAKATSNGNTITMGTVQIGNDKGEVGSSIDIGTLFNISNLGSQSNVVTTTRQFTIQGTLPVKLSLATFEDTMRVVKSVAPAGVISTWWRHYKSNILVSVKRTDGSESSYTSRPDSVKGGFDSIFDTIEGTTHTPATDNTTGLSTLLDKLGVLNPGDVVTITTKTKFERTTFYNYTIDPINGLYTLTQDELNAFQGKSLTIDIKLVATEQ